MGAGGSAGSSPGGPAARSAPSTFVMRVQEPRRLRAGECAAVEAGERDPLGLASPPAEGLERLFAAPEMGDHRPYSVTSARSARR